MGRVNGHPLVTLATATAPGIRRSVRGGLKVVSTSIFGSSFGHSGLCCRVHPGATGVSHRVVGCVGSGRKGSNVVCYLDHGGIRRFTSVLGTGNVGTLPCRTNVSSRRHSDGRSTFLVRGTSIVITAVTFNVKVSGPSMQCIVRCSVPGDLRKCCRRAKQTNHSNNRNRYVTFCTCGSLRGLRGFVRKGPITRRRVNGRLLLRATTCTRASMYQQGILLRCFNRRCLRRGYKGYSGYLGPGGGIRTGRLLDTMLRIINALGRGFGTRCVIGVLINGRASRVRSCGRGRLRVFNSNSSRRRGA